MPILFISPNPAFAILPGFAYSGIGGRWVKWGAMAKSTTTPATGYSEGSIRVLKGLEPVKQRPGMYTRTDNPLHVIQEVIDNAADEALAGFGKKFKVTLHADG